MNAPAEPRSWNTRAVRRAERKRRVATELGAALRGKQVATGQATADQWQSWLRALPGKLTAGECMLPLDYTMFDYLEIGTGWQRPLSICQGNKIRISGTPKVVSAWMSLRATRECTMSPTMATVSCVKSRL